MFWIVLLSLFVIGGCEQKPQERVFTEVSPRAPSSTVEAPADQMANDPHAGLAMKDMDLGMGMSDPHAGMDLSGMVKDMPVSEQHVFNWDLPKGWAVTGGSMMRLATIRLSSDPKAFDCSIVSLAGMAGGTEANLNRWMGQLGIQSTAENLKRLTDSATSVKTKGGLDVTVYDLSMLLPSTDRSAKSLMVGMMTIDTNTVFIKMTGTAGVLKEQREAYLSFIKSLRRQ